MDRKQGIDPTTVRLSEHFLLSDLMGCSSIYAKGYTNIFEDPDGSKLKEAKALAEKVLEPLLEHSRFSVTYGYISPELSRKIVTYQDPNKPSYHRWDAGAAVDVVLHERIHLDEAPIYSAFWIDEHLPVSRVITYSESPGICVASRLEEIRSGDPRRALYENRYVGERKPKYISYSNNALTRLKQKRAVDLEFDWEGAGYPTYHGGGKKQLHHYRTGTFTLLTDWLYSDHAMEEGLVNAPASQRSMYKFKRAAAIYDELIVRSDLLRCSIVRAYESPVWSDSRCTWVKGVFFVLVPPASVSVGSVIDTLVDIPGVHTAMEGAHRRIGVGVHFKECEN